MDWRIVPAFMASLREMDDPSAPMLEFAILTTVRTKPVLHATWPEIDLDNRVWTIPAAHQKDHREHQVPLSDRAVAILEAQPCDREYVFLLRGHATLWNLLQRLEIDVTPHGFRSSFRDWAGEQGHNSDAAEAALSHKLGDSTRVSYQRGTLFAQRQELMDCWSTYCAGAEIIELVRAA